jgi:hypothetical protein
MPLQVPNTFANKTDDILLSELDGNFTYVTTQLDTTNTTLSLFTTGLISNQTELIVNKNLNIPSNTLTASTLVSNTL